MLEDSAKLWWDGITGPTAFVRAIADNLGDAKSVVLFIPADIPWHEQMRRSVSQVLHEYDADLLVDFVDCKKVNLTDTAGKINIPYFLLEQYAYPAVKSGYRQSSGHSIQQYLLSKNVLINRVVWVTQASADQASAWINFCNEYHAKSRYDGLFIIEANEKVLSNSSHSGVNMLRYRDYTSYYDSLLFNNMICSAEKGHIEQTQYKATVSALICSGDAELSKEFVSRADFTVQSPVHTLQEIFADQFCLQRYDETLLDETHPLSIIRSGDFKTLQYAVWKAQLQVLFPLIESERIRIVEQYEGEIEAALATEYFDFLRHTNQYITQYGERVTRAHDVEIGTLYRMSHLKRASDTSLYLFFLPNEEDRDRLALLHDMRNSIAHVEPCPVEMVTKLLSQYPYEW